MLITYHPVTLKKNASENEFGNLIEALDEVEDTLLIFTKANADTDGRLINEKIDDYVSTNKEKAVGFTSLGHLKYFSLMNIIDGVVGNSSSGLTEVPSFKIGTVNIGDRQKGRMKCESVINCKAQKDLIKRAITRLYSPDFKRSLRSIVNPYGDGRSASRIKKILKNADLKGILLKSFHDI